MSSSPSRIDIHVQKGAAVPYQHANGKHFHGEGLKEELIREATVFVDDVKKGTMTWCPVERKVRPFQVSDWRNRAEWIVRQRLGHVKEEDRNMLAHMNRKIKVEQEEEYPEEHNHMIQTNAQRLATVSRVESWVAAAMENNRFRRPLVPSQTPRILARPRLPVPAEQKENTQQNHYNNY